MESIDTIFDITIIGGGPVGMFAAFYGGMRNAKVKIIESLPKLGGQLATLYPEKKIYDIAGFPEVKAQDLVNNLEQQMSRFETTICLEEEVLTIVKNTDNIFVIKTGKQTHYSKTVIVTAGNGAFQPRRLELEDSLRYEGTSLHYYINNLNKFKDRRVAISGGGDSAVDWALMLEPIASEVFLIHRRNQFRAHEHSVSLLEQSKVQLKTPFIPTKINGTDRNLDSITLKEVRGDQTEDLKIDDLLVNYGFISSIATIKN